MDTAHLLSEIIASGGPVSASPLSLQPGYADLINAGFVEECGVLQSVLCDDCSSPHDAELFFEDEQYGLYCPELGFIPKLRTECLAVRPNVQQLLAEISRELNCKRRKTSPIHGETWRVGLIPETVADVIVYFHSRLRDGSDLNALKDALSREPRAEYGVVITATGHLGVPQFPTIQLKDCLCFDVENGRFAVDADLPQIAGVRRKNPGGRPSPYAEKLAQIISMRKASGETLSGVNEESRAIQAVYKARYPADPTPSSSTIKQAMKKA